jgi:polyferredoxin
MRNAASSALRAPYKWALGLVVPLVLALGWKYPLLGFIVPAVMVSAIVTGFFRGRWFCGHLCPRGAFFDSWLRLIGGRRPIPPFLRSIKWRPLVSVTMIGYMVWRIGAAAGDPLHWGHVFWEMCLLTTLIGVPLALVFRPRAWCAMCPIGTLQMAVGGHRERWRLDAAACVGCGACQKSCPLSLPVVRDKARGIIGDRDCLKCGECARVCPTRAITPPGP